MKIAICVQQPTAYQQLSHALNDPKQFRFHDFQGFSIASPLTDFKKLVDCVTEKQAEVLIVDTKVSFFEKARAICQQFDVEFLAYDGQVDAVLREVDMFASFKKSGTEKTEPLQGAADQPQEVVVKIGERVIEKEVETLRYTTIPPKVVVIGSLWSGAGSTLYGMNLARAIAERHVDVSYVEYPKIKPYLFDYLNMSQLEKDLGTPYHDLAKKIAENPEGSRMKGFRHQGVQWIVNDSRLPKISQWLTEDMSKLVYSLRDTPIVIVDISDQWADPAVHQFLHSVDNIFVCVEPDPVKIDWASTVGDPNEGVHAQLSQHQVLNILQDIELKKNIPYNYIELKMNDKVKINTWHECLEKQPISSLDWIPYPDVMAYTWESKLLYDHPQYHKELEKSFRPLIEMILPNGYAHPAGLKKSGFFQKWIKRGYAQ